MKVVDPQSGFSGPAPGTVLFPKLATRRTWLMVKKDLERAKIDYETPEGIADFRAAGRHSHITGLVRSGASLAEVQKLARLTDIKLTMRYTHVGIEDQTKPGQLLPYPRCTGAAVWTTLGVIWCLRLARSPIAENDETPV